MSTDLIVQDATMYVKNTIQEHYIPTMYFHNLQHTLNVFDAATKISGHCKIDHSSVTTVQLAALFHDTGYSYQYLGHEDMSMSIAEKYLIQQGYHQDIYQPILNCIEATKIPQAPKNLMEQILCDADFYHFASPDYFKYADQLRNEWEVHLRKKYADEDWLCLNISVLTQHQYFTEYGKTVMQAIKQQNIDLMRNTY